MEKISREQFMEFFRSEDFHSKVTPDDCVEIFRTVLTGSSDITKELINDVISDYCADNVQAIDSDYLETYYEIVREIEFAKDNETSNVVDEIFEAHGTGGLYELAVKLTNKFQEQYGDTEWDGEFYDTLEQFLENEIY